MKLFVIPGHGAGDPGACGNGYSEAERVRALATKIKEYGGSNVILADFSRNYYEDNGISRLDLSRDCQIVELHMDSGTPTAKGGHVIIQAGIGGADRYDRSLADSIAEIFPGRAEALVERDDLANPARAAARGYGYRLVENGFISNAGDVKTFNERIDDVARAYLSAFGIEDGGTMAFTDGTYEATHTINIREKRRGSSALVCKVAKGATMKLGKFYTNGVGNVWAQVLAGDHKGRYVCVKTKRGTYVKRK